MATESVAYRKRIDAAESHLSAAIGGNRVSARLAISAAQSAWQASRSADQRRWCAEIIADAETLIGAR